MLATGAKVPVIVGPTVETSCFLLFACVNFVKSLTRFALPITEHHTAG